MRRIAAIAATLLGLTVAACSGSSAAGSVTSWSGETSAGGAAGMNGLIAAARAEGQLNLIGTPRDWAHYGYLIDGFQARYGIRVTDANPNAVSQEELDAAKQAGKSRNAPDVFDLRATVAAANSKLFAPYKVDSWDGIPTNQKDAGGAWFEDYGGYMAIGEDTAKLPVVAQLDDLLQPKFRSKVALKGDPTLDDTALNAVMMVSLNEGGSLDDIGPGVDWFHKLRRAGNYLGVPATNSTVKSLQTSVVLDWEFLSGAHASDLATWQVVVPGVALLASYYAQAINKQAPHPAAARLWEEWLYSSTGQNEWLRAGLRPVEMTALQNSGKIDPVAAASVPRAIGTALFMSQQQLTAARTYLAANWAKAVA